jgi:23S rRNA (adenine2503-C2)-methyltransferase
MKEPLFGKTIAELGRVAAEADLPAYAARQLADWLYGKGVTGFEEMRNLPRAARARLAELFTIGARPHAAVSASEDGTRKYLFPAGEAGFVETAFIPEEARATLCLSVQIGCKWGCAFCMTGRQGFHGNLGPGDILNQFRSLPEMDRVTNIVYMGMGEPMDNLENVLASLEVLCSSYGYGMSPTRITVSTVGVLPAMEEFLAKSRCHLAVSLHSPFEEERRRLMPVEARHPMKRVIAVCRKSAVRGQRRISFEYVMFDGVNDTRRHAAALAGLLHGMRCRVNLIPFHPVPGSTLTPSRRPAMERFQAALKQEGMRVTIRQSRGLDISAACGLLSTGEPAAEPAGTQPEGDLPRKDIIPACGEGDSS